MSYTLAEYLKGWIRADNDLCIGKNKPHSSPWGKWFKLNRKDLNSKFTGTALEGYKYCNSTLKYIMNKGKVMEF